MVLIALATAALSPALAVLFNKLSDPIVHTFARTFQVEKKLKELERTMTRIIILVSDTEMRHPRSPSLDFWLRELKDVAYDVEDVLDDLSGYGQSYYNIGKRIEEIQESLAKIAVDRKDLGLSELPRQELVPLKKWRETSSVPTESSLFGRENDKIKILTFLLSHDDCGSNGAFAALPVVGMGGLGKTALVQQVYNDPSVAKAEEFEVRIWVWVSNTFDVKKITEEIMESVSHQHNLEVSNTFDVKKITEKIMESVSHHHNLESLSLDKLQSSLKRMLRGKRFLLVLDDVWSESRQEWETLCAPLRSGKQGSKILITTRSTRVARVMGTKDPFFLNFLDQNDCWNIIKTCAFSDHKLDVGAGLEEIGTRIAERAQGVPLAAKAIAGLLRSNIDEDAWITVLESEIWKLPQYEANIMPALELSYLHMPDAFKLCFNYCSLFPKGHKFDRFNLVRMWIAQGFVHPERNRRLEDVGDEIFDDLLSRSFFQKVSDYYLMHDLLHDLAQSVAEGECAIIDHKARTVPGKLLHSSLYVDSCSSSDINKLSSLKRLRTLIVHLKRPGLCELNGLPNKLFIHMRVLDLSYSGIRELPTSVSSLKQLRYLDLTSTQIRSLPSDIDELSNLQTLQMKNCPLSALPESITNLSNLQTLEVQPVILSKIARIGRLTSLQKLPKFVVSKTSGFSIAELENMKELQELCIENLQNVANDHGESAGKAQLPNKHYLRSLELQWSTGTNVTKADEVVLECLRPQSNLKVLRIKNNSGAKIPKWLTDKLLPNLENISLIGCRHWKELPQLRGLRLLRRLEIGEMSIEKVSMEFCGENGFPSLQVLIIYDMFECTHCFGFHDDQLLPSLRELTIRNCPKLEELSMSTKLPKNLERLELSKVGSKQILDSTSSSTSSLLSSPSSSSSSLPTPPPSPSSSSSSLLSKLSAYSKLSFLSISKRSEPLTTAGLVSSLEKESLDRFPPGPLISLTNLKIEECPNINTSDLHFSSSLQTLIVGGMHNAHFLVKQFPNLGTLTTLDISRFPDLISLSRQQLQHLKALRKLTIGNCDSLSTLEIGPTSLKTLHINNCKQLEFLTGEGLPEDLPFLSITINDCPILGSLPGELTKLQSLKELHISRCPCILFLPDLPQQLQILTIIRCTPLAMRYGNGGSDWEKVSKVPHFEIY